MSSEDTVYAFFKAVADFSSLDRETKKAQAQLAALQAQSKLTGDAHSAAMTKASTATQGLSSAERTLTADSGRLSTSTRSLGAESDKTANIEGRRAVLIKRIADGLRTAIKSQNDYTSATHTGSEATKNAAAADSALTDARNKMAQSTRVVTTDNKQLTGTLKDVESATRRTSAATQAGTTANVRYADSHSTVSRAAHDVTSAETRLAGVRGDLQGRTSGVEHSERGLGDAYRSTRRDTNEAAAATRELEGALAAADNALKSLSRSNMVVADSDRTVTSSHYERTRASGSLARAENDLARAATGAGGSGRGLDRVLSGLVPGGNNAGSALGTAARSAFSLGQAFGTVAVIAPGILAAIVGIAGAAISLVSAIGSAAGALAALPGLFAAAGQGLGTVLLGFSGISAALKAYSAVDAAGAQQAQQTAQQRVTALQSVKNAQQGVADAQIAAIRSVRSAQEGLVSADHGVVLAHQEVTQAAHEVTNAHQGLVSAEVNLRDAQNTERDSQIALTEARKQAVQALIDLRNQVTDNALSEQRSQLNLDEAQQRLQALQTAGVSTNSFQYRDALLSVEEAQQSVKEAHIQTTRSQGDLNKREREGINGAPEVVTARNAIVQAQKAVAQAHREVASAQYAVVQASRRLVESNYNEAQSEVRVKDAVLALSDARRTGAESVAKAQQTLANAQTSLAQVGTQATAAQSKLADAMSKLSPGARQFVQFIHDKMIPAMTSLAKSVQGAIFTPAFLSTFKAFASDYLPLLRRALTDTAVGFEKFAVHTLKILDSPFFKRQFTILAHANVVTLTQFGKVLDALAPGAIATVNAFNPLVHALGQMTIRASQAFTAFATSAKGLKFFHEVTKNTLTSVHLLGDILGNFGHAFANIFRAAVPSGFSLLRSMDGVAKAFAAWTDKPANVEKMKQFFNFSAAVLRLIGRLFVDLIHWGFEFGVKLDELSAWDKSHGEPIRKGFERLRDIFKDIGKILGGVIGQLGKIAGANPTAASFAVTAAGGAAALGGLALVGSKIPGVKGLARGLRRQGGGVASESVSEGARGGGESFLGGLFGVGTERAFGASGNGGVNPATVATVGGLAEIVASGNDIAEESLGVLQDIRDNLLFGTAASGNLGLPGKRGGAATAVGPMAISEAVQASRSGTGVLGAATLAEGALPQLAGGGFTIHPGSGEVPKAGYLVSQTGASEVYKATRSKEELSAFIADYVKKHPDAIANGAMLGGYEHKGKLIIEPSDLITNAEQAVQTGVQRNQNSIYDIAGGREIETGGNQASKDVAKAERRRLLRRGLVRDAERGAARAGRGTVVGSIASAALMFGNPFRGFFQGKGETDRLLGEGTGGGVTRRVRRASTRGRIARSIPREGGGRIARSLGRVGDAGHSLLGRIADGLILTGGFLKSSFDRLLHSPALRGITSSVSEGLGKVRGVLGGAIEKVAKTPVGRAIGRVGGGFGKIAGKALGPLGGLLGIGGAEEGGGALAAIAAAAGPITVVVAAIAALTAGLILAYKNIKPFHDFIDKNFKPLGVVFNDIARSAALLWHSIVADVPKVLKALEPLWKEIKYAGGGALRALWLLFKVVFFTIAAIIFGFVKTVIFLWHYFGKDIVTFIKSALKGLIEVFRGVFEIIGGVLNLFVDLFTGKWSKLWGDVKHIFHGVWLIIAGLWKILLAEMIGALRLFVDAMKALWHLLWKAIVALAKAAWDAIKNAFESFASYELGRFRKFWNGLKQVVTDVGHGIVSAAKAVWDGLKAVFERPIEFIVNTVIGKMIGAVNWVLKALHLPKDLQITPPHISFGGGGGGGGGGGAATQPFTSGGRGGHNLAFAAGGSVPGYGNTDTVPARLTPGEFVVRKDVVNRPGVRQLLSSLNEGDGTYGSGRRGGGILGKLKGAATGAVGGLAGGLLGGGIGRLFGGAGRLLRRGASASFDAVYKHAIRPLMEGFAGRFGKAGQLGVGAADFLAKAMSSFLGGHDGSREGVGNARATNFPPGSPVGRWSPLVTRVLEMLHQSPALAQWVLQLIAHESGGNPNAINLSDSNAAAGDPSRGLMQTIGTTFSAYAGPYSNHSIYDPLANIYAGLNYGIHRYGSVANIPGIRSLSHGGPYVPYAGGGLVGRGGPMRGYAHGGIVSGLMSGFGALSMPQSFSVGNPMMGTHPFVSNLGRGIVPVGGAPMIADGTRPVREVRGLAQVSHGGASPVGEVNIYYPEPGASEDGLTHAMQKMSYLGVFDAHSGRLGNG